MVSFTEKVCSAVCNLCHIMQNTIKKKKKGIEIQAQIKSIL